MSLASYYFNWSEWHWVLLSATFNGGSLGSNHFIFRPLLLRLILKYIVWAKYFHYFWCNLITFIFYIPSLSFYSRYWGLSFFKACWLPSYPDRERFTHFQTRSSSSFQFHWWTPWPCFKSCIQSRRRVLLIIHRQKRPPHCSVSYTAPSGRNSWSNSVCLLQTYWWRCGNYLIWRIFIQRRRSIRSPVSLWIDVF